MKTYISSHNTKNSKTKDSSGIGSLYFIGEECCDSPPFHSWLYLTSRSSGKKNIKICPSGTF